MVRSAVLHLSLVLLFVLALHASGSFDIVNPGTLRRDHVALIVQRLHDFILQRLFPQTRTGTIPMGMSYRDVLDIPNGRVSITVFIFDPTGRHCGVNPNHGETREVQFCRGQLLFILDHTRNLMLEQCGTAVEATRAETGFTYVYQNLTESPDPPMAWPSLVGAPPLKSGIGEAECDFEQTAMLSWYPHNILREKQPLHSKSGLYSLWMEEQSACNLGLYYNPTGAKVWETCTGDSQKYVSSRCFLFLQGDGHLLIMYDDGQTLWVVWSSAKLAGYSNNETTPMAAAAAPQLRQQKTASASFFTVQDDCNLVSYAIPDKIFDYDHFISPTAVWSSNTRGRNC